MTALTTEEVLRDEAKALHGEDRCKTLDGKSGDNLYQELNKLNSAALCLSGGGIRSASFALGVIQALAVHPRPSPTTHVKTAMESLLAQIHYLSTVSGGGYIGSWLSVWVTREGFAKVWQGLVGGRDGSQDEPRQITWLRTYSNYLTPRVGITSADTWAGVALYLRNLILNWLIIFPAFCVVLLILKLVAVAVLWAAQTPPMSCDQIFAWGPAWMAVAFLVGALRFTSRHRPTRGDSKAQEKDFVQFDLIPALLSAFFFVLAIAMPCGEVTFHNLTIRMLLFFGAALGAVAYAIAWIIAFFQVRFESFRVMRDRQRSEQRKGVSLGRTAIFKAFYQAHARNDSFWDFVAWTLSGIIYGLIMTAGVYLFYRSNIHIGILPRSEFVLLVFAGPWVLGAQLCSDVIFAGLSSFESDSDADQEWLGRAAGWYIAFAMLWFFATIFVFARWDVVATQLNAYLGDHYKEWLTAAGGVSGIVTWILGKSSLTPAVGEPKNKVQLSAKLILAVAAPMFAILLVIGLSVGLDYLLFGDSLIARFSNSNVSTDSLPPLPSETKPLFLGLILFGLVAAIASIFVNINRFSLHALYRNRLIRAFLGASSMSRNANPFTDFDPNDNLSMYQLAPAQLSSLKPDNWQPFQVINITLNTVSPKKLAWQERKAEPFTVSPLHSGSSCKGFRSSFEYGSADRGISVGTAVAISGAAVSPNMGYQSSPAASFALALFNVRLGWWLGNPGKEGDKTYTHDGPHFAVTPFANELLGRTTDDRKYVYLSDGGHFENLGLYEMVRRRCRLIVLSDAGCDPDFKYDDLGNAIRKIEIDLGVTIKFSGLNALKGRSEKIAAKCKASPEEDSRTKFSVGTIEYPSTGRKAELGTILYVKPQYSDAKIRNVGVKNYAKVHEDFPHQDTSNQWFTESQFESYRALGFEMMDDILNQALSLMENPARADLERMLSVLNKEVGKTP